MKKFILGVGGTFVLLIVGLASIILSGPKDTTLAQEHIAHVATKWEDTPSNRGLLPTALKEAIVAAAHAQYSKNASDDLDAMQLHTTHVRHAIDPALEAGGPGLGYGLLKASEGVVKHITLASQTGDASEAVKAHTEHVVTAMQTAMERTKEALAAADAVMAATTVEEARKHVLKMAELTEAAHLGWDVNGDGQITWNENEGGLKIADQHIDFMLEAEGLSR